mmetsp:Transcript_37430/g.58488  ORF Transcript_37430/g.58488 Transcript_37430/m.58488 type:complete len:84 (+) Transcript_37430:50-301(+)
MKDHYPERLARVFIINAPRTFSAIWGLVNSWLDERIRGKLSIIHDQSMWRAVLQEQLFDLDLLPTHLGGKVELSYLSGHTLDP